MEEWSCWEGQGHGCQQMAKLQNSVLPGAASPPQLQQMANRCEPPCQEKGDRTGVRASQESGQVGGIGYMPVLIDTAVFP